MRRERDLRDVTRVWNEIREIEPKRDGRSTRGEAAERSTSKVRSEEIER